jgi:RNA polymerase sigma factor (sigma-70 family)
MQEPGAANVAYNTPMDTPETLRRVRDYWHLCRITAKKQYPYLPDSELDDLEAVGLVGLLRAARSWRPGGGASFQTFAITAIQRVMRNQRTNDTRRWRRETGGGTLVSLDMPVTESGATLEAFLVDPAPGVEEQYIEEQETARRRARILAGVKELPRRQRQAIELHYIGGKSPRETAEAMQVSDGATRTTLSRAVSNLRRVFQ